MKIKFRHFLNLISIILIIALVILGIWAYRMGIFTSIDRLRDFLKPYGYKAPLVFMLLQIVQIVLPIIPGGVSLAFGVLVFGAFWGFVYNYISICLGSIIVFLISRYYGKSIVISIFGEKYLEKYDKWLDNDRYTKFFALAILFPFAPDDFLSYLSGLTDMKFKDFVKIVLVCKVPSIMLYSLALKLGISGIFNN